MSGNLPKFQLPRDFRDLLHAIQGVLKLKKNISGGKRLNIFYVVIYRTQKVHNDITILCSILLSSFGHFSNHEYHC